MSNESSDITLISEITPNIYLSGIFPLANHKDLIKKNDIKYILCCVNRDETSHAHDKIMINDPNVTVLYLPYSDDLKQNLWTTNRNKIKFVKYSSTSDEYNIMLYHTNLYKNKPMIEIGFHFMNSIVDSGGKILVHCMAGISRSVSVVVYYLMKKHFMKYSDAISFVKNKRSIASPNNSFKLQLELYQVKRDRFKESDADKIIQLGKNKIINVEKITNELCNELI